MNSKNHIDTKVRCEIYCRVTGFYRPVAQFNPGKKEEFRLRRQLVFNEARLGERDSRKKPL